MVQERAGIYLTGFEDNGRAGSSLKEKAKQPDRPLVAGSRAAMVPWFKREHKHTLHKPTTVGVLYVCFPKHRISHN